MEKVVFQKIVALYRDGKDSADIANELSVDETEVLRAIMAHKHGFESYASFIGHLHKKSGFTAKYVKFHSLENRGSIWFMEKMDEIEKLYAEGRSIEMITETLFLPEKYVKQVIKRRRLPEPYFNNEN